MTSWLSYRLPSGIALVTLAGALMGSSLAPMAASAASTSLAKVTSSQEWTGNGDGSSWDDPMNWGSMSVPADGDSVTIQPTAAEPTPHVTGVPGGTQLQDLTLTDASLSGGDVTVMGDFMWGVSHGFEILAAPLTVEGAASIGGAGEQDVQDPVTFDGTADITGPGLLSIQDSGPAVTNSGTMTLAAGVTVRGSVCCVNPDVFLNTGTVTVASGTATVANMDFNDQGSVSVSGLLDVTGGPGEFGSIADVSGGGTLRFDLAAHITLATGVSIGAGTTVALTGNAEFFGPGSFAGGGKFSWSGGSIDGNLDVGNTIHTTVSGTAFKSLLSPGSTHALLAFHGPTTVQGSGPLEAFAADISTSGTFTVKPGATVEANACCVSPDRFLNTGTLTVPASTSGTATLARMDFNDQGPVSAGAGSTLHVINGVGEFSPGVGISGGGAVEFDQNAQITLASNLSIGPGTTLTQTAGATFLGTGSFTGTGNFLWTGGTINGSLNVGSAIKTTISGTATKAFMSPSPAPTVLAFHGKTTLEGSGELDLSGATTVSNLGTFTVKSGTTIGASTCCVSPDRLTNSGTLTVAAGTGTATVSNLAASNSGTVKITGGTLSIGTLSYKQTAGATQLAGGSLSAAKQINIAGGTLSGFGTVTGSVLSGGTVSPNTTGGVLKITGTYKQTSAGVLTSVITGTSPGTKFGQLRVGGKATLAGTLKVSTGGGFVPTHGESFPVLLYKSHTGTFTTLSGSPSYTVAYHATAADVVYP